MLDDVTVLIITYNEGANIARTLAPLGFARRIVVVDSGSTDGTLAILAQNPRVEVKHRPYTTFADQCNFGLDHVATEWVLSLDADYELSEALVEELHALKFDPAVDGYRVRFVYRIFGRPLRGTLYPPRTVLYRTRKGRYSKEAHGHRVRIDGVVRPLAAPVYHDDRKPLSRWLASQQNYAREEADYLLGAAPGSLGRMDRLRRAAWPAPIGVLFYTLIVKRCLLDGWAGWYYALQRLLAEVMIALEVVDRRLRGNG